MMCCPLAFAPKTSSLNIVQEEVIRGDVAAPVDAHAHVRGADGEQEGRGGGRRLGRRGDEVG